MIREFPNPIPQFHIPNIIGRFILFMLVMLIVSCDKEKAKPSEPQIADPGDWELVFNLYTNAPELYTFAYVTATRIDGGKTDVSSDSVLVQIGENEILLAYSSTANGFTSPLPSPLNFTVWGETLPVGLSVNGNSLFAVPVRFVHISDFCSCAFPEPDSEAAFAWLLDEDSDEQMLYLYSQGENGGELYSEYIHPLMPSDRSAITPSGAVTNWGLGTSYWLTLVQKNAIQHQEHRVITTHKNNYVFAKFGQN